MKIRTHTPLWRRIVRAAALRAFHAIENNGDVAFERNGELCFLREVSAGWAREGGRHVVFAVGAKAGEYTARVLEEAAQRGVEVVVHAFDPSSTCAGNLRRRFADARNVVVHVVAVGEQADTLRLRSNTAGSTRASLVARDCVPDLAGEEVSVVRLDERLRENGVTRIDLLKLDVEGAELAALRGLGEWLNPARVPLIQFEYGGTTLDARTSLGELFGLLEARGYRVGKLFPGGIELRRYSAWMDHFSYSNFVALAPTSTDRSQR